MGLCSKMRGKLSGISSFTCLSILLIISTGLFLYVHQHVVARSVVFRNYHGNKSYIGQDEMNRQTMQEIQACIPPNLTVNDPVVMKFFKKYPKVICKTEENWVYVQNGTIRFSERATLKHGNFQCTYVPVIRGPGDYRISFGKPILNISDGAPLVSDFFKVYCKDFNNKIYENIHAGIHVNTTIKERLRTTKPPANGLGLSIAFLGFDSMSRMSWLRRMPKTREYMVNDLKAIELEGYNILGDGTPHALLPILTGKHRVELPESRRNAKGAKPVDDFPWLWKDFSRNGYVTSWADAQIEIAPFNYAMLGFEHSPADYFMRPFYLAVDPLYKRFSAHCHRSEPKHMVWFNWIRDIFYMYKDDPKFLIHFYTPLSHDDNNPITMADDDLRTFISNLEKGGFLNHTLLLVMADHGARFAEVRRTVSGKLEERLPYVSLRFPPWFEAKYPHLMKNVRTNAHRLTTPFDLHETFKDFLRFDGAGLGDVKNRGISLFKEIPKSRTCDQADANPHWCACLAWKSVPETDPGARRALITALEALNNKTQFYRSDCALLSLGKVMRLLNMFTKDKAIYQMTFSTKPGNGEYESTVEYHLSPDMMSPIAITFSTISQYGSNPACILHKNREIRQYCYCNKKMKKG